MVEHHEWDEGKTNLALNLLVGLSKEIDNVKKELSRHVAEKFGRV